MSTVYVVARFDDETTAIMEKWKQDICNLVTYDGTKGWPPHLTLAGYEGLDSSLICDWTRKFATEHESFEIRFDSLGVFCRSEEHPDTEVIYALPAASEKLTSFYYAFHRQYDEYCGNAGRSYSMIYGYPTLHTSLSMCKTNEFEAAFGYMRRNFKPIISRLAALEVYEFPQKAIARCDFKVSKEPSEPLALSTDYL